MKRIYRLKRGTFFENFAKTVRNTMNQSMRTLFQYKFTIKPVIFGDVDCQKGVPSIEKVCGVMMV